MENRLKIEIKDHIADVRMVREDKMNALDDAMFEALIQAGDSLAKNGDVRCVVISGQGKGFCAGLDLSMFKMPDAEGSVLSEPLETRTHGIANKPQKAVWTWREMPVPVIAAVHGVAIGGGLHIMLGADIRYIEANTKCAIMEMKWGIIPDLSTSQIMIHSVREDIIRELTYTNRMFSGTQAVEWGFATHVSEDPYADAMKMAQEIASKNPDAIQAAKHLFNQAPYLNQTEGLSLESRLQDKIIGKPNQIEAVLASLQKRKGKFKKAR
ncbi:MAG: crotonase/enoyl-CoA hydratase family protein [Bacteroidia bacterium]|nr:crotonase/enoyl-CoA hydratase family protein [Bacteroidia bacterium]